MEKRRPRWRCVSSSSNRSFQSRAPQKRERLAENLGSLDLKLSEAEMAEIAKLQRPDSRIVSPPQAPVWDVS
jgi:diketogulonate reductase-like aldo/keto reductase